MLIGFAVIFLGISGYLDYLDRRSARPFLPHLQEYLDVQWTKSGHRSQGRKALLWKTVVIVDRTVDGGLTEALGKYAATSPEDVKTLVFVERKREVSSNFTYRNPREGRVGALAYEQVAHVTVVEKESGLILEEYEDSGGFPTAETVKEGASESDRSGPPPNVLRSLLFRQEGYASHVFDEVAK